MAYLSCFIVGLCKIACPVFFLLLFNFITSSFSEAAVWVWSLPKVTISVRGLKWLKLREERLLHSLQAYVQLNLHQLLNWIILTWARHLSQRVQFIAATVRFGEGGVRFCGLGDGISSSLVSYMICSSVFPLQPPWSLAKILNFSWSLACVRYRVLVKFLNSWSDVV